MNRPSILIVEDEAIVAADLAGKCRRLGYAVAGLTATGEAAVQLARQTRPALVLMDIHLAGPLDGFATASAIQQECQIPVIFLTAQTDSVPGQRAQPAATGYYIQKPFADHDLRQQIARALAG